MIQPEEIDRLASSGVDAIAADQGYSLTHIAGMATQFVEVAAGDAIIDIAWYLHTRGLSKERIDEILYDAADKFDTEYKLPEGD